MSATDTILRGVRGLLGRRTMDPGSPPPGSFFVYQKPGDRKLYVRKDDGTTVCLESSGGGSGDVVGPSSSVASEVALFDGTTGKLLKRASGTGVAYLTSGVLSVLTASGVLDLIGSTRGATLYRGASGWAVLAPGTAGQTLHTGGSGADPSWQDGGGVYGSGLDGAIDFDGASTITLANGATIVPSGSVYTVPQDIEATTYRTRSGVRVDWGGFIAYGNGLATFDDATAIWSRNGGNASGTTAGAGVSGGSLGTTSTSGGAGTSATNVGNAGGNVVQGLGARGGGGGASGGGQAGGGSGTRALPAATAGSTRSLGFLLRGCRLHNSANWQLSNGGSGGGGGGCNVGTGTASSGAGGGGAGVLVAFLRYVTGPGILEASGGNGSNAGATGNGAAGGGGGGGGGYVALVTSSPSPSVTVRAPGGTAGTGAGGGAAGTGGGTGQAFTVTV